MILLHCLLIYCLFVQMDISHIFLINQYCSRPKRLETAYFLKARCSQISVIPVKTCDIINVAFIGILLCCYSLFVCLFILFVCLFVFLFVISLISLINKSLFQIITLETTLFLKNNINILTLKCKC